MFFPFGDFDHRVKIHQAFWDPIRIALQDGIGAGRARVDLTAHQHGIQLGAAVTGNKPGIFEFDDVGEQAPFDVSRKANGFPC